MAEVSPLFSPYIGMKFTPYFPLQMAGIDLPLPRDMTKVSQFSLTGGCNFPTFTQTLGESCPSTFFYVPEFSLPRTVPSLCG